MQQSVNAEALLGAVRAEVDALERLCADLERAMMSGNWDALSVALAECRRVQHALHNAMHEAAAVRSEPFDAAVSAKLRWIFTVRDNQMSRLQHYKASVRERLHSIARVKKLARHVGVEHAQPRLGGLNQLI